MAGRYLSVVGANIILDYKSVEVSGVTSQVTGQIQLLGVGYGFAQISSGGFGYEIGGAVLGTNSQNLSPPPQWGTPWYFMLEGAFNYSTTIGIYFRAGANVISTFYQNSENHYLGAGLFIGAGYKFSEALSLSLTNTNSSVLFSGDNTRVARGMMLALNWYF